MELSSYFEFWIFFKIFVFSFIGWILYEPIPINTEKIILTYLIYLMRRISRIYNQSIIHIKVLLGNLNKFNYMYVLKYYKLGVGIYSRLETARRREPVEKLNPKLNSNCCEEIIEILERNLELRIFRPEIIKNNHAIIYFHGGGFVMCHARMYRLFLSNLGESYPQNESYE